MIVQIRYCVDGTGDVKSNWAVYVAHQSPYPSKTFQYNSHR